MSEESNVFEVKLERNIPKKEYYHNLLEGITPDAVFVLGGGNREIIKQGKSKRFTTSPYKGKFYPDKTGGAKARPVAAAELAEFYPNATIVTMSHRPGVLFMSADQTTQPIDQPAFAQVLHQDLLKLKVKNEIIEKPKSTSTLTEIMEMFKLMASNINLQNAAVVVNDYQVERAQKILDILTTEDQRKLLRNQLQFLFTSGAETGIFDKKWAELEEAIGKYKQKGCHAIFVSAEDILSRRSPHYEYLVNSLRKEEGYRNVSQQEKVGNIAIDNWEYHFDQPSFKEYILS